MSLTETLSSFPRLSMVSNEQLGASFTKSLLFHEAFITVLFRRRWTAKTHQSNCQLLCFYSISDKTTMTSLDQYKCHYLPVSYSGTVLVLKQR